MGAITGRTRLFAIVGDPILQVKSPEAFNARFAREGIDAVLIPVQAPSADLATVMEGLKAMPNLDGIIVTVPHKVSATHFVDRLLPSGARVGAINALRRAGPHSWEGDMFDGIGFVRGLTSKGHDLAGRRAMLFGAGGAGSAIAVALADAGVTSVAIVDPDEERTFAMKESLEKACPDTSWTTGLASGRDANLIVNASPVGMRPGDGLPAPLEAFPAGTIVGDVIPSGDPTPLLRLATAQGCPSVNGLDMLAGQQDSLIHFFLGR